MSTPLTRRSMFGLAAALSCPLCARAFAADAPHWGYERATGPEHWGDLEADFRTCEIGTQQSPIDLTGAVKASLSLWVLTTRKCRCGLEQRGLHPNQCAARQPGEPGWRQLSAVAVSLPSSERAFARRGRFDMEAHFVNQSADGSLCALACSSCAARLTRARGGCGGDAVAAGAGYCGCRRHRRSKEPVPADLSYFEYEGSLTTPPCPETVNWVVFRTPIEASRDRSSATPRCFRWTRGQSSRWTDASSLRVAAKPLRENTPRKGSADRLKNKTSKGVLLAARKQGTHDVADSIHPGPSVRAS